MVGWLPCIILWAIPLPSTFEPGLAAVLLMGHNFVKFIFIGIVDHWWRLWRGIMFVWVLYVLPEQTYMKTVVLVTAWWQVQGIHIVIVHRKYGVRAFEGRRELLGPYVLKHFDMFGIKKYFVPLGKCSMLSMFIGLLSLSGLRLSNVGRGQLPTLM